MYSHWEWSKHRVQLNRLGAVGDGITDDSQAFLKAWQALCSSTGDTTLNVPNARSFLLKFVQFKGPCKSSTIHIEILGTLIATSKIADWGTACAKSWIGLFHVDNLIVDRNSVIEDRGLQCWNNHERVTILLVLSSFALLSISGNGQTILNVVDFGAIGNSRTDNTLAFTNAWGALCGAIGGTPLLQVPEGVFRLKPVNFTGPCKSTMVHIQVIGSISAPSTSEEWGDGCPESLITIFGVNGVTLEGPGTIEGRGKDWWNKVSSLSCLRPVLLNLRVSSNVNVGGLRLLNSPSAHISIAQCNDISISNVYIKAPENSPNTDGIDMIVANGINIFDSSIGTGDDCIAIKGACSSINITGVNCGPGHGISVGSLGQGTEPDDVEDVYVKNCTFTGTTSGAKIKTIPGGLGSAKKITFDQITLNNANFPIVIDQFYCLSSSCQPTKPSFVKVSDITYSRFIGTSTSDIAIALNCSSIGCTGITMLDNDITLSHRGSMTSAFCINAQGTQATNTPHVSCLAGN